MSYEVLTIPENYQHSFEDSLNVNKDTKVGRIDRSDPFIILVVIPFSDSKGLIIIIFTIVILRSLHGQPVFVWFPTGLCL